MKSEFNWPFGESSKLMACLGPSAEGNGRGLLNTINLVLVSHALCQHLRLEILMPRGGPHSGLSVADSCMREMDVYFALYIQFRVVLHEKKSRLVKKDGPGNLKFVFQIYR